MNTHLSAFEQIIGQAQIKSAQADKSPHLTDWRGNFSGEAQAVLFPSTTAQVSAILEYADRHNLVLVTQGGNTGLVGGGIPDHSGEAYILSTSKMDKVRELSVENRSVVVESGCILENLHNIVEQEGLFFPLNLGAKGSCSIGGNLATNAGGLNVLRYGNMRDLCLGLEVVLLGGKVMNLLSPLRKDNTGYDLKHLFIGSEGTLGVITAASLKLFALPCARATALVGIPDISSGVALLDRLQRRSGDRVDAFEIIPGTVLEVVSKHFPDIPVPLSPLPEFMILMEITSTNEDDAAEDSSGQLPLDRLMETFLADCFEDGMVTDAVIARNETQRSQLWQLREHAPEGTKAESWPVNTDISVTRTNLAAFYECATRKVHQVSPEARICGYGHLGDGNLHFNIIERDGGDPNWADLREPVKDAIYEALAEIGGSISAEHGIGQLKAEQLIDVKDPVALGLMHQIKQTLDPKSLLNPGKILLQP